MYNEYSKDYFKRVKLSNGKCKYYLKPKNEYIEVSEEIYKVCKRSQDKIQYDKRKQATKSTIHYEGVDDVAFLFSEKYLEIDIIRKIFLSEVADMIIKEINELPMKYKDIAICIFVKEMSEIETSLLLGIPKSTVHDRKIKIQKILQEKVKKFG